MGHSSVNLRYVLDPEERIVELGGDWSRLSEPPLGRSIWRYIRGHDLQQIYAHLYAQSRRGRTVEFPYRCDTPTHRRRIWMTIAPEAGARLSVSSRLVESSRRRESLAVVGISRGQCVALRCSICNRMGRREDWLELTEAASARWLDSDRPVRVYHGVCPECRHTLLET